jgi:hypothetical protein
MAAAPSLGVRWTIGDVNEKGFEALRLSIWGAWRIFGPETAYAVCVNSLPLGVARARTGDVPKAVAWHRCDHRIPSFLRSHLDSGLAEGVAWKFAPLRLFPHRFEIALDNDCILWAMPEAIRCWLSGSNDRACVIAEDVAPGFGQFAPLCGMAPRNTGVRGMPAGFDFERALRDVLAAYPVQIASELDEQGLQIAALSRETAPLVVSLEEVSICSPQPPHMQRLGTCGAHFVGINVARTRPYCDNAALNRIARHWESCKHDVYGAVDLSPPD